MTKTQVADLAERAGWTLVEVAAGFGITELADIKAVWAVPLAAGLSFIKTLALSKEGAPAVEGGE